MNQTPFHSAIELHRAGKLEQAEAAYRQTLAAEPQHVDATHLLGVIFAQRGDISRAEAWIRRAIILRPDGADFYQNLANAMAQAGNWREAVACFRQFLALRPDNHAAFFQLATILHGQGDPMGAIDAVKSALQLQPHNLNYRAKLASFYMNVNRPDLAATEFREAIAFFPNDPRLWHNLGSSLCDAGELNESLQAFDRALRINPSVAAVHCNKAVALMQANRRDDAITAIHRAIELDPKCPGAHTNLGAIFYDEGRLEEALATWRIAVAQDPADPRPHWNLARVLLRMGQFAEGWEEFEWRLKVPHLNLSRAFAQPQWDGSDPTGKTILLHTEGGFGDALHFIRLLPQVTARGGRWLLECQPELIPLFQNIPGLKAIIPRGQNLPPFDLQIPLQSLPRLLSIRYNTIPNTVPYLQPPTDRTKFWSTRILSVCLGSTELAEVSALSASAVAIPLPKFRSTQTRKRRVGLVWAGSNAKGDARTRHLEIFAPLAAVPNVQFFSLQKGPECTEPPPRGMDWTDFTAEISDFADTAAFIQNLDLVITVDTSIAHLAGALAKPVWVVIPFQADFRWHEHRTDSPWYPTMRLFREPAPRDIATPIAEIVNALEEFQP